MYKIKCRVLNMYGVPENLSGVKEIEVDFPHESADILTKSMTNKHVKILDMNNGEIEVELSDFETQGMKASEKQTFYVKIRILGKTKTYRFNELLHVKLENGRKVIV